MKRSEEKPWSEEKHEIIDQNVCLQGLLSFAVDYYEANPHSHYYRKLREEKSNVKE